MGLVPTRKGSKIMLVMIPDSTCSVANECSPALDMVYPELCSCICLGSCGEMQAVLQLFGIGCGFTVSLSKTLLPPRLTIPTPLVALLLSLNFVLSHCAAETSSIISIPFIALYWKVFCFGF